MATYVSELPNARLRIEELQRLFDVPGTVEEVVDARSDGDSHAGDDDRLEDLEDEDIDDSFASLTSEQVNEWFSSPSVPRSVASGSRSSTVSDEIVDDDDDDDDEIPPPLPDGEPEYDGAKGVFFDAFAGAGKTYGKGRDTLSEIVDTDEHSDMRSDNRYYPFSCEAEWELVSWMVRSALPMTKIDEFLKLKYVSWWCCLRLI